MFSKIKIALVLLIFNKYRNKTTIKFQMKVIKCYNKISNTFLISDYIKR